MFLVVFTKSIHLNEKSIAPSSYIVNTLSIASLIGLKTNDDEFLHHQQTCKKPEKISISQWGHIIQSFFAVEKKSMKNLLFWSNFASNSAKITDSAYKKFCTVKYKDFFLSPFSLYLPILWLSPVINDTYLANFWLICIVCSDNFRLQSLTAPWAARMLSLTLLIYTHYVLK